MDKKNTFLGLIFIIAGIGFMFWQSKQLEEQRRLQPQPQEETSIAEEGQPAAPADNVEPPATDTEAAPEAPGKMLELLAQDKDEVELEDAVMAPQAEEKIIQLSNDYIEAEFTTRGGAIRKVSFLKTKRGGRDDYIFNEDGYLPALSLSLEADGGKMREFNFEYTVESQSSESVTFALDAGDGFVIRRSYEIAEGEGNGHDPYVIKHQTTFVNRGQSSIPLKTIYLNLGTARHITDNSQPNYLNVGYYDGEDADFIAINKLTGSGGFLGIGANSPKDRLSKESRIEWSSVKNQFFAAVLSSEKIAGEVVTYPVEAMPDGDGNPGRPGITGNVGYSAGTVASGASTSLEFDYYVGPKEFKRLQSLGNEQDLVMQFGFLGFFSKILLAFMYAIHSVVPSWGWSIVIMTICVKTIFLPLTAKASRSQKRMAAIQGPMSELKEKYKDNPQKMQQETLKLFKEHQVNPLAGCLPMIIQMPIFLGLFYMLRTASELRHEPFLWVSDLAQPDTIMEIGGFPLNLLPLLMGLTMFLQMHMMPVSPTADPMQQKIFKFMPLIFMVFLYNFSSGLTLYWTVQNILTIIQQKYINSRPDPEPVVVESNTRGKSKGGKARKKK